MSHQNHSGSFHKKYLILTDIYLGEDHSAIFKETFLLIYLLVKKNNLIEFGKHFPYSISLLLTEYLCRMLLQLHFLNFFLRDKVRLYF